MNRRRLIIFLLLFVGLVVIGGVVVFLVFGGGLEDLGLVDSPTPTATVPAPTIISGEQQITPVATRAPDEDLVEVVVSLQTVPRGFQMTEAELTTELRIADNVGSNVITDIEDVTGKYARTDIYQGETLTFDSLASDVTAAGRNDAGPSSRIPPGFVAMAVPLDRQSSVGYALQPGDAIDILVSFVLIPVDEEFQTRLPNDITFNLLVETSIGEGDSATTETQLVPYTISPGGRFEELPNGDIANIGPSEVPSRGTHVAFVIQNARVIEVGPWVPPVPPLLPTATPDPEEAPEVAEEENTNLAAAAQNVRQLRQVVTGPPYNYTMLVALPPQQQVFLKYAIESRSIVDYALRGEGDGELYPVENVSLDYVLERFNIEVPPNFTYVVATDNNVFDGFRTDDEILIDLTEEEEETPPEGNQDGQNADEGNGE